jgi:hypothetical protein
MQNQAGAISQVNLLTPVPRGFEILKWPRRLDVSVLTHELVNMDNDAYVSKIPLILKSTEVAELNRDANTAWLKLNGVKAENFDAIGQATIGLTAIVESYGYNISNISIKNWANTIIKNWVDKVPKHSETQELLFFPTDDDIIDLEEFMEFFGSNPLVPLRLNNDLRSLVRFLDQRITYDNYCAVIRTCWIARKELGSYSRMFFDKLILLSEQCLDHTLYANANMDSYNHQITNDPSDWLEQMFMVKPVSDKLHARVLLRKKSKHNSTSQKRMQIMQSIIASHAQAEFMDNLEVMELMHDSGHPSSATLSEPSQELLVPEEPMDTSHTATSSQVSTVSQLANSTPPPNATSSPQVQTPKVKLTLEMLPEVNMSQNMKKMLERMNSQEAADESLDSDGENSSEEYAEPDSESEAPRKTSSKLSSEYSNTDWSDRSSIQGVYTEKRLTFRRRKKHE